MDLFVRVKETFSNTKFRLQQNTYASLLWLVNIVPSLAGFSIQRDKISGTIKKIFCSYCSAILDPLPVSPGTYRLSSRKVYQVYDAETVGDFIKSYVNVSRLDHHFLPFWIFHLSLLVYIYGVGSTVYQVRDAQTAGDFIKSYVNVTLFVLIANNSYWFIMKRPLLKSTLDEIREGDRLAIANEMFRGKHERSIKKIKLILVIFYGSNVVNATLVYLPHRVDVLNDFAMTPCYGMEPLTKTPNREICLTMLCAQELSIMTVVLNYQALLLLLIAQTALLYDLLSKEILTLNDFDRTKYYNNPAAKTLLPVVIRRHAQLLSVIDKLKCLYSVPIGVNFGSNAVCISLFFYLPLKEWLQFMPILVYCFLVFFLYCFLCQRLSNAAENFEMAVYACGWETFDTEERKAVYCILRQAQKPVELLAADIIPVNISTFATTLQAMFKFVTVVKV